MYVYVLGMQGFGAQRRTVANGILSMVGDIQLNEYFLNEYFGFCFELNFELNHFQAQFNEKMNLQNGSARASSSLHYIINQTCFFLWSTNSYPLYQKIKIPSSQFLLSKTDLNSCFAGFLGSGSLTNTGGVRIDGSQNL